MLLDLIRNLMHFYRHRLDSEVHTQQYEGLYKNANRGNSSKDDENDLRCLHVSCSPVGAPQKNLQMCRLFARNAFGSGAGGGVIRLPACFDRGLYAFPLLVHELAA